MLIINILRNLEKSCKRISEQFLVVEVYTIRKSIFGEDDLDNHSICDGEGRIEQFEK